jgi:hypothetical protein
MKKIDLLFTTLLGLLFFASCGTTRQLTSKVQARDIDKILILKPFTKIDIINKGNKAEYSLEHSKKVLNHIQSSLSRYIPQNIKTQELEIDTVSQNHVFQEMYSLVMQVEQKSNIEGIILSDKMIDLIHKDSFNFVLGVLDVGFTRAKGNYGDQVAKGIGIGLLTFGLYVPIPVQSSSTLICFIIDEKNRNIAFYRKSIGQGREPTDKLVIDRQISEILNQYFQKKLNARLTDDY